MKAKLEVKYLYVTISDNLAKDFPAIVYRVKDKYVYVSMFPLDANAEAIRFQEIGNYLLDLERRMGGKLELVYENRNKVISERIRNKMKGNDNANNNYKMLKYL